MPAMLTPEEEMVHRWADAGERRIVAGIAALRLREAIARQLPAAHTSLDTAAVLHEIEHQRPSWPQDELRATLLALDGLRFAPARADNAMELYRRGIRLAETIAASPL
jgi:hypothetical protein